MVTDWLMVLITTVYVLATIVICRANIEAAKASKMNLDEIRRQYAEENRPNIEVEFLYEKRSFYGLRFINNGRCTAHDVQIELDSAFLDSIMEECFSKLLRKHKGRKCVIGIGQHYDLFFGTNKYRENPNKFPAKGVVNYKGNGVNYQSDFYIDLEHYATIFSITSEYEELKKKANDIDTHLKGIERAISKISESMLDENDTE